MSKLSVLSMLPALLLGCQPAGKPAAKQPVAPAAPAVAELTSTISSRIQSGGVTLRRAGEGWAPLVVGSPIPAGASLRTAAGVRARLALKTGTVLDLDESSELVLAGDRRFRLTAGELLAEVSPAGGATAAEIETGQSEIRVTGTKLNVKVESDATLVDVSRGTVEVSGRSGGARVEVGAGERAVVRAGSSPKVGLSKDLAEVTRWSRELAPKPGRPESLQPGIGSLEARVPPAGKSSALRLARQEVRVVVQDNVARTEVEQEYENPSSETLEGTYRFPLPGGATISRLALYMGNRLEEGEIVERQRARQIFRQIVDDTVRPRDPALLEWVGGRTFQMKIFPIPPRSSRRVILGYTQVLPASYGRYRYEYPMASEPGRATTVGRFLIDLRATSGRGLPQVQTPLYPMITEKDQEAVHLRYEASDFRPAASFVASLTPASQPPELQVASFEQREAAGRCAVEVALARQLQPAAACGDRGGFFMAVLRPELPTEGRARPRDYLFMLDSSYSSGKRGFGLQLAALETFLGEMDLRSRFGLMICDASCRTVGSFEKPIAAARQKALAFARGVTPGGSSNLQLAFEEAAALLGREGVSGAQVIYLGDGRPTAGELREPELARRMVAALQPRGARLSAIQIGDDASELLLPEATRRLGGAVHRLSAGDDVAELVLEVVAAQYRPTLTDIEVSFEPWVLGKTMTYGLGVHHVYPARLPSLTAGSEAVLVGRYDRGGLGTLLMRGQIDGRPFERRFPVELRAGLGERDGNRFIPRVWAQHHLEALSLEDYARNRPEIVRVSKAYAVLSRATAFLVLENERMYREFGVSRTRHQNDFQAGKVALRGSKDQPAGEPARNKEALAGAAGGGRVAAPAASEASPAPPAPPEEAAGPRRAEARDELDMESPAGDAKAAEDRAPSERKAAPQHKAAPAPDMASRPEARRPMGKKAARQADDLASSGALGRARLLTPPRPVVTVRVTAGAPTQDGLRLEDRLRQQVAASPLRRGLHAAYHRVLMQNGSFDEALRHAAVWAELDGTHAQALAALADAEALQSDLASSLRTRASTVEVEPWNPRWHRQLAEMYRNKGQLRQSCAHLWSLVSLAPRQTERVAALARCLAELPGGRETALALLADELGAGARRAPRAPLLGLLRELRSGELTSRSAPHRALTISATWDAPVDLDIVLTTPGGDRISSLAPGRLGGVEVDSHDGRTAPAELLSLRALPDGEYRVEMVRLAEGGAAKSSSTVSGALRIQAAGRVSTLPFTLSSASSTVARLQIARVYPRYSGGAMLR